MFIYGTSFKQFGIFTLEKIIEKINSLNKNSITELGAHSGFLTLELSKHFHVSNLKPAVLKSYNTFADIRKILNRNKLSNISVSLIERSDIEDYIKQIKTDIVYVDNSFLNHKTTIDLLVEFNIICDVIYVDGDSIIHINTESLISQKRKESMVIQPEPQPQPEPAIEEPVINTEEAVPEYAAVEEVKEEVVVEEEKVKPKRRRRSRSKKTNSE